MNISVVPVTTRSELDKFIKLPWKIYRGDKNWVPPLIKDMKEVLAPGRNARPLKGERGLFLALVDRKPSLVLQQ